MAFDRQPVLVSDLVRLRPLRADDAEPLRRIAADPLLWEQHPAKDRTQEPVFRAWFQDALGSGGALVAQDRADSEVFGVSRYVPRGTDAVEIGWTFLARSRWGGRWNGEVKRLMLDHAFAALPTVLFTVHADNLRSQRAVERLGARRTGTHVDVAGLHQVTYRLDRSDVREVAR
ncbi:GNAT family N-acetyltransferase [Kineococcus sp. LSe6-4]|uniref:GNAT family N-acetyltransferase n=1 Tax=Kineococcus halophytocola TaxID=3234027 RepID=A0ABV4GV38_9ACTN